MSPTGLRNMRLNHLFGILKEICTISPLYQSVLDADKGVCTIGEPLRPDLEPDYIQFRKNMRKLFRQLKRSSKRKIC